MTKAVVLEIKEGYAAVLTEGGFVQKIPDRNYTVGQQIVLPETVKRNSAKTAAGRARKTSGKSGKRFAVRYRNVAAAAVLAIVSFGGFCYASENVMAYSTVTLSAEDTVVELTLNKKNEVVAVKALDEKSEAAVRSLEISFRKRKNLQEAMEILEEVVPEAGEAQIEIFSRDESHRKKLEDDLGTVFPKEPEEQEATDAQTEQREPDAYGSQNIMNEQGPQGEGEQPENRNAENPIGSAPNNPGEAPAGEELPGTGQENDGKQEGSALNEPQEETGNTVLPAKDGSPPAAEKNETVQAPGIQQAVAEMDSPSLPGKAPWPEETSSGEEFHDAGVTGGSGEEFREARGPGGSGTVFYPGGDIGSGAFRAPTDGFGAAPDM